MFKQTIHTGHPVYYVSDLDTSLSFFEGSLGLECIWKVEEQKLAGIKINDGAILVLSEDPDSVIGPAAPVYVFNIEDTDKAFAELKDKVTFTEEPCDRFYGRAVEFTDPDGYRFCLVS